MNKPSFALITLAAGIVLPFAVPAQQDSGQGGESAQPTQQQTQQADDDGAGMPVFGRQLMTQAELAEHRARMRAATSADERARIRAEHHQQMLKRARERGVTLPEQPPARGPGMGPGMGPGQGMGLGQGQQQRRSGN